MNWKQYKKLKGQILKKMQACGDLGETFFKNTETLLRFQDNKNLGKETLIQVNNEGERIYTNLQELLHNLTVVEENLKVWTQGMRKEEPPPQPGKKG